MQGELGTTPLDYLCILRYARVVSQHVAATDMLVVKKLFMLVALEPNITEFREMSILKYCHPSLASLSLHISECSTDSSGCTIDASHLENFNN